MHSETAFGHLDVVELHPHTNEVHLAGWVVTPEGGPDRIVARLEGEGEVRSTPVPRPDVQSAYPALRDVATSGYHVVVRLPEVRPGILLELRLDLWRGGRHVATQALGYRVMAGDWQLPPPDLMQRVSNSRDLDYFRISGGRHTADLLRVLRRHRALGDVRSFLDWGCGCGRLSRHLVEVFPDADAFGTDIDAEATAWLQAHAPRGRFFATGKMPPMPFAADTFDLVVASSVFTHLTQAAQDAWLEEMRRILAPGGLLLASAHGEHSATVMSMSDVLARLHECGFYDAIPDRQLGAVASGEYYRSTFQTHDYTRRVWGRVLEIVECVEGGLNFHQDLWVLRKPA